MFDFEETLTNLILKDIPKVEEEYGIKIELKEEDGPGLQVLVDGEYFAWCSGQMFWKEKFDLCRVLGIHPVDFRKQELKIKEKQKKRKKKKK